MPKPKILPNPMVEIRPLLPSVLENNAYQYYAHMSTDLVLGTVNPVTIPKGVRYIVVQAVDQNIRYVISGDAADPSQTSGFQLIAGNDPLAISVLQDQVISFAPEAAGARLEMQFCQ
jgi:hypothetical protein